MTNIDKIAKTIYSCKTIDQLNTCYKWVNDLHGKELILKQELYMFFHMIRYHTFDE